MEGKFSSLYKGRMAPEGFEKVDQLIEGESKVLVTSGADLVLNAVSPAKKNIFPLGLDPFTQQQFANQDFILSALSYMIDDLGLINAKNKNYKIHLLDNKIVADHSFLIQIVNILLPMLLNLVLVVVFYIKRKRSLTCRN